MEVVILKRQSNNLSYEERTTDSNKIFRKKIGGTEPEISLTEIAGR